MPVSLHLSLIHIFGRQEVMNPLLRKVGLKLLQGIIAQPSDVNPGELVLAKATQIAADSIGGFYKRMVTALCVCLSTIRL